MSFNDLRNNKKVLVTGAAGFIGFHLTERLIKDGFEVVGLDVINDYYSPDLKLMRLLEHGVDAAEQKFRSITRSTIYNDYRFLKVDLADHDFIIDFMKNEKFNFVVNLAAQAGVRYSIDNPKAYTHSNIDGFLSVLEGARYSGVQHLVYASTSSVYGLNTQMPLSENQPVEHPISLYSATKKANELMAHCYSHLFQIPTTGLRFFTVYGPWGRPDMALFLFTEAMLKSKPIRVFNHGKMIRDFTYIDDIIESISRLVIKPTVPNLTWDADMATSSAPYQVFNIGNSEPVELIVYIEALEKALGCKAKKTFLDIQPGDVLATHADTSLLENYINFKPSTSVEKGVKSFVDWYRKYYYKHSP